MQLSNASLVGNFSTTIALSIVADIFVSWSLGSAKGTTLKRTQRHSNLRSTPKTGRRRAGFQYNNEKTEAPRRNPIIAILADRELT